MLAHENFRSEKVGSCVSCQSVVTLDSLVKKYGFSSYECKDCHSEALFRETYQDKKISSVNLIENGSKLGNKLKKLVEWCFG